MVNVGLMIGWDGMGCDRRLASDTKNLRNEMGRSLDWPCMVCNV